MIAGRGLLPKEAPIMIAEKHQIYISFLFFLMIAGHYSGSRDWSSCAGVQTAALTLPVPVPTLKAVLTLLERAVTCGKSLVPPVL